MLSKSLKSRFIQRDDAIEGIEAGLISGHNVLLIGSHGTAKSALCRAVAASVGARYFEVQLAPTTAPEEVFGPPDIEALTQRGEWRRRSEHYAPCAEIAFFDEFFRGSPAIRDTLLSMLGEERLAYIDGLPVRVPLLCGIGATNFLDDSPEQQAILDRWCLRIQVSEVSPEHWERLLFSENGHADIAPICTAQDVLDWRAESSKLSFSPEARSALLEMIGKLSAEGIRISDRRKKWGVAVARARARIAGRDHVALRDLAILRHVYWGTLAQAQAAHDIVLAIAWPGRLAAHKLTLEIAELAEAFQKDRNIQVAVATIAKLKEIGQRIDELDAEDAAAAREMASGLANDCRAFVTGGL